MIVIKSGGCIYIEIVVFEEFGSLTHYDYGFRIYNSSIARFLSVDPLTKSYPMLTPYQFASNSPIEGIDLDGLEYTTSKEAIHEISMGQVWVKTGKFESGIDANGNAYIGNSVPVEKYLFSVPSKFPLYSNSLNKKLEAINLDLSNQFNNIRKNKDGSLSQWNWNRNRINIYEGSQRKAVFAGKVTGVLIALDLAKDVYFYFSNYARSCQIDMERSWIKQSLAATQNALDNGDIKIKYQNTENLSQIANYLFEGTLTNDDELNDISKYIAKKYLDNLAPDFEKKEVKSGIDNVPNIEVYSDTNVFKYSNSTNSDGKKE